MVDNFRNFIGGEWVAPASGEYFENRNPADWDDVIGCFPRSGAEDGARAVGPAPGGGPARLRAVVEDPGARPRRGPPPSGRPARPAQGGDRARHDAGDGQGSRRDAW